MKIDHLAPAPTNADELLDLVNAILAADDGITDDEKEAVATGFLMGLGYALVKHAEGKVDDAARTLLQLQIDWSADPLGE